MEINLTKNHQHEFNKKKRWKWIWQKNHGKDLTKSYEEKSYRRTAYGSCWSIKQNYNWFTKFCPVLSCSMISFNSCSIRFICCLNLAKSSVELIVSSWYEKTILFIAFEVELIISSNLWIYERKKRNNYFRKWRSHVEKKNLIFENDHNEEDTRRSLWIWINEYWLKEENREKEREKSLSINRTSTTNKEIDKEKEIMLLQ